MVHNLSKANLSKLFLTSAEDYFNYEWGHLKMEIALIRAQKSDQDRIIELTEVNPLIPLISMI